MRDDHEEGPTGRDVGVAGDPARSRPDGRGGRGRGEAPPGGPGARAAHLAGAVHGSRGGPGLAGGHDRRLEGVGRAVSGQTARIAVAQQGCRRPGQGPDHDRARTVWLWPRTTPTSLAWGSTWKSTKSTERRGTEEHPRIDVADAGPAGSRNYRGGSVGDQPGLGPRRPVSRGRALGVRDRPGYGDGRRSGESPVSAGCPAAGGGPADVVAGGGAQREAPGRLRRSVARVPGNRGAGATLRCGRASCWSAPPKGSRWRASAPCPRSCSRSSPPRIIPTWPCSLGRASPGKSAARRPTAVVAAADDPAVAETVQRAVSGGPLRVYAGTDRLRGGAGGRRQERDRDRRRASWMGWHWGRMPGRRWSPGGWRR